MYLCKTEEIPLLGVEERSFLQTPRLSVIRYVHNFCQACLLSTPDILPQHPQVLSTEIVEIFGKLTFHKPTKILQLDLCLGHLDSDLTLYKTTNILNQSQFKPFKHDKSNINEKLEFVL